jgi:hypothetical protein
VKKHSSAAIIEKLAKANELAAQGISQNTICRRLGISVMTLHRWRARAAGSVDARLAQHLLLENGRLRNVAANILLQIRALEESWAQQPTRGEPAQPASRRLERSSNSNNADQEREQALPTEA